MYSRQSITILSNVKTIMSSRDRTIPPVLNPTEVIVGRRDFQRALRAARTRQQAGTPGPQQPDPAGLSLDGETDDTSEQDFLFDIPGGPLAAPAPTNRLRYEFHSLTFTE